MTDRIPNGIQSCPHGRPHNAPCPDCRRALDRAQAQADRQARAAAAAPELADLLRRLVAEGEGWELVEQARTLLASIDGSPAPAERGQ